MLPVDQWRQGATHWNKQNSDDFRSTCECPKSKKAAPQSFVRAGRDLRREYLTLQKLNSWNSGLCSWEDHFQEHGHQMCKQVLYASIPHRFALSNCFPISNHQYLLETRITNCTNASYENISDEVQMILTSWCDAFKIRSPQSAAFQHFFLPFIYQSSELQWLQQKYSEVSLRFGNQQPTF